MAKAHPHVAALLTLLASLGLGPSHADEARLDGAAAWQALVGNTVVTRTAAGSYTEFYAPDGGIRRVDADGNTTGQWSSDGERVCFDYPDDDDHTCVAVTLQGSSGSFTDAGGTVDRFEVLKGNARNL